jgi:hypothetical protein
VSHAEGPAGKVNILPLESGGLAWPHLGVGQGKEQHHLPLGLPPRDGQECRELLEGQRPDLLPALGLTDGTRAFAPPAADARGGVHS